MKTLQLIDRLDIGGAVRMSVNIATVLAENEIENLVASGIGVASTCLTLVIERQ